MGCIPYECGEITQSDAVFPIVISRDAFLLREVKEQCPGAHHAGIVEE